MILINFYDLEQKLIALFIYLIVGIVALFYNENSKAIIESGRNNSIVKNNALTMMYETEYQSGEYQVTSDSLWLDSDSYTSSHDGR